MKILKYAVQVLGVRLKLCQGDRHLHGKWKISCPLRRLWRPERFLVNFSKLGIVSCG
uniref:Uncharacterized protein n=1 Tax=Arundo donax TaxID=35708 RepID=A0A0A9D441_ARUDO